MLAASVLPLWAASQGGAVLMPIRTGPKPPWVALLLQDGHGYEEGSREEGERRGVDGNSHGITKAPKVLIRNLKLLGSHT